MKQPNRRQRLTGRLKLVLVALFSLTFCAMPTAASALSTAQTATEQNAYTDAAKEFGVPQELLLAVGYYQSRWEDHGGQMSVDGGYGPMNLRTKVAVQDERGDPSRPLDTSKTVTPKGGLTLDKAAELLKASPRTLQQDVRQNIRGGAAVIAEQAKQQNNGKLPTDMNQWYAAASRFLGSNDAQNQQLVIDDVYNLIKEGKSATTTTGQRLNIPAKPDITVPDGNILQNLGIKLDNKRSNNGAECPSTDTCRFIPAGYAANSSDPADYGNYDYANRPKDMKVNYIVIHDTEGSYMSAIQHFQDTTSYVSAHYVIRSSDGDVTQMVPTSGVAWHAGDWYMNMHSIGIEHEGYAAEGASWYTEAMYRSSANLVRYLAKKYDIPLDRDHIIGHDNIPGLTDARAKTMHWDPGPYWDWNHYMELLTGKKTDSKTDLMMAGNARRVVTINPTFAKNVQTVNACVTPSDPATCADLTAPSNFVYLRTAARSDAPLISDPLLHPGGEPGTRKIDDWTAKATTGQQYAVAERQGDWTAIWFAGQKAWFYNPASQPTATAARVRTVSPKPGLEAINVYGGAYPESSVYPADVSGPAQPKLSYTIKAGQKYVSDGSVPTDYFYDATIDYSKPHDHEIFAGKDKYIKIWYNQRTMFVKADDVVIR